MTKNLPIDPRLIDQVLEVSGEKTKQAAVTKALEEFVARHERRDLLSLFGTLEWTDDFDYKAARSRHLP